MKVRELMTTEPITVEPKATLGEVATLMKQQDCGSIPVVDGGRLVGIVTDRDIVVRGVAAGKDPKTQRVSEVMSADPVTIPTRRPPSTTGIEPQSSCFISVATSPSVAPGSTVTGSVVMSARTFMWHLLRGAAAGRVPRPRSRRRS